MSQAVIQIRPGRNPRERVRITARIDELRREWSGLFAVQRELERQFVEDDLSGSAGPGDESRLSRRDRRQRLDDLLDIHHRTRLILQQEWQLWRILGAHDE